MGVGIKLRLYYILFGFNLLIKLSALQYKFNNNSILKYISG
jgi:hypothetical protein